MFPWLEFMEDAAPCRELVIPWHSGTAGIWPGMLEVAAWNMTRTSNWPMLGTVRKRINQMTRVALMAGVAFLFCGVAQAETIPFAATLNGASEVPPNNFFFNVTAKS